MQDFNAQWQAMMKNINGNLQDIAQANATALKNVFQGVGVAQPMTAMMETLMKGTQNLEQNKAMFANELWQKQLQSMNLANNAAELQNLSKINSESVMRIVQSQMDLLNAIIEKNTNYMSKLPEACSSEEVIALQQELMKGLQQAFEEKGSSAYNALTLSKQAYQNWLEAFIRKVATSRADAEA